MSPNNLYWKEPLEISDPISSQSSVRLDEVAQDLAQSPSLRMEISQTLCCSVWPPSRWIFSDLFLTGIFLIATCVHCLSPFYCTRPRSWAASVPSNSVVEDSGVIPPPPTFSLLRTEDTQLSQSLLVHPWSPSKCAMWYYSSVLSARLSICWQGLLLLEQRGRPPCEGLWKITADAVISARNSGLNRVS